MSQKRFNKIVLELGARGTGKTTFMIGDKSAKVKGLLEVYKNTGMKILIVDTDDHPHYRHIPILSKKDFLKFKKGIARIIIDPESINDFCRFLSDSNNQWNTVIVWEDARKHSEKSICKELNRLIGNTKQQNIDMFFMYHSFGETPKDIYRKLDYIVLFKTMDSPEERKEVMSSYIKKLNIAYNQIQASPNRFINKTIGTIDEIK